MQQHREADNYVVGSGPAGIAATAALLARGLPVTLLDAGGELEPEIESQVDRLRQSAPEGWPQQEVEALRGELRYNSEGTPLKLLFGSDYPYRDLDRHQRVTHRGADVYRAFAAGGLSTLWGASVLPYDEADLTGWPLRASDLHEHYRAVLEITGLAADHDELEALYPLYVEPTARLELSSQAAQMLARMRANATELREGRIFFGRSRLAIGAPRSSAVTGCVHCGMCLYGCPYGLIYSAEHTLRGWLASASPNAPRYLPGFVVQGLAERGGRVEIRATSRTGETRFFDAPRVFLASGVFSTTRILLESAEAYDHPLSLCQSDHFLLPMLMTGPAADVTRERLHTLSQLCLSVRDPELTDHTVHLQLYTYNDYMDRMARARLGVLHPVLSPLVRPLLRRLVLLKGYLHSDESSRMRATLERSPSGATLHVEGLPEPEAARKIRRVAGALSRHASRLGARPLRPLLRVGLPGSGVHVGGSYPMTAEPGPYQTDRLGRPLGFERVHVVDSTVFPTVPAPTITLTIMANAHRIASLSAAGVRTPR